jgi:hypothetical protein
MSDVSQDLQDFLQQEARHGQTDSRGVFTQTREKMLEKLAGFQLPFEGAWVLKIVQAAVASSSPLLRIVSTDETTRLELSPARPWTIDEVEQALCAPESRPDPALGHLATALRAVGFGQRRAFTIKLADAPESLLWEGRTLSRCPAPASPSDFSPCLIEVGHVAADAPTLTRLASKMAASWKNAEVIKAVAEWCYSCPIPLEVDGRRMDSLQLCPEHGWSQSSDLLGISFPQAELPELPLSQRTLSLAKSERPRQDRGVGAFDHQAPLELSQPPAAVVLHTLHLQIGNKGSYLEKEGRSHLYWIRDGVIVQKDVWEASEAFCSLGCFVSAQGLAADLTTLSLRRDPHWMRRRDQAARAASEAVRSLDVEALDRWTEAMAEDDRKGGKLFLGLGVIGMVVPPIGFGLLMLGGLSMAMAGQKQTSLVKRIKASIESQRFSWSESTPPSTY